MCGSNRLCEFERHFQKTDARQWAVEEHGGAEQDSVQPAPHLRHAGDVARRGGHTHAEQADG